jgi:hypothetical protein
MAVKTYSGELDTITSMLQPWRRGIDNPAQAQLETLQSLLQIYSQSEYGKLYEARRVSSIEEYQHRFPIVSYEDCKPWIQKVMHGRYQAMLNEPPAGWAVTRGTTKGEPKLIPMTSADLKGRFSASRAMLHYVINSGRFDLFEGVNLNLGFPSIAGSVNAGGQEIEYGYSSGISAKYTSAYIPIRSLPEQADIDHLGGGKTREDWEKRFALAYETCKTRRVTMLRGSAPAALGFGRWLHDQYKVYPKDIWKIQLMTLGSVPGVNTRLAPALRGMYGDAAIREVYSAAEGTFGQQMDERRAWMPNYDQYFFEVRTSTGLKLMHDMSPGENGHLIVSTPALPRCKIGDIVRANRRPYFRTIGREHWWTGLHYLWQELSTANFGRL